MEPQVDPVSGNEVPPGAMPSEVRDDVDAKLSKGEYVLPADVVRYLGLEKIEALVKKAKEGIATVASGEVVEEEDDLPFALEELLTEDSEPTSERPVQAFASGGLVNPLADIYGDRERKEEEDEIPFWMKDVTNPVIPNVAGNESDKKVRDPVGIARPAEQWSPEDFDKYMEVRDNPIGGLVESFFSSNLPFAKQAINQSTKNMNKKVPELMDKMISSGMDLQGNPLTSEQIAGLQKTREKFTPKEKTRRIGGLIADSMGLRPAIDEFTSPIKEAVKPIKDWGQQVKQTIREAVGLDKEEEEKGVIDRPDKTKDTKDTSSKSEKSGGNTSKDDNKDKKSAGTKF